VYNSAMYVSPIYNIQLYKLVQHKNGMPLHESTAMKYHRFKAVWYFSILIINNYL